MEIYNPTRRFTWSMTLLSPHEDVSDQPTLPGIHATRIRKLNAQKVRTLNEGGRNVVYWMSMTQRSQQNHALHYAIQHANRENLPLVVYQGLNANYPHASDRIHTFILQGVADLQHQFEKMDISYGFYLAPLRPKPILPELIRRAAIVIADDFPSFITPALNRKMAARAPCAYHVVDGHTTVPMNYFQKEEWAAYTIRPKIHKVLEKALEPISYPTLENSTPHDFPSYILQKKFDVSAGVARCPIDHTIPPTSFQGGERPAHQILNMFLEKKLSSYAEKRNNATVDATSDLSPYLHFGMIDPATIVRAAQKKSKLFSSEFIEELVVRRDLAYNYAFHNPNHTTEKGLNDWAKKTLQEHEKDARPYLYTKKQLEGARTHDELWNAAQRQMVLSGKMNGYLRMYWAKKILEWTPNVARAFEIAVYLNDRYELDGRDPNGYAGIAWSLGGKHDRAWFNRPIFGKIRYLSAAGAQKKFDTQKFIQSIPTV